MWRDLDPRADDTRDRPDPARAGHGAYGERMPHGDDPRDVFTRDLDLPRGPRREWVRINAHFYRLRGSEVRTLATVGAFRVVPEGDLRAARPDRAGAFSKDLTYLRRAGLIETAPYVVGRTRTSLVTLTERGRSVLEAAQRAGLREPRQHYYAGLVKPRELAHDVRVYAAYDAAASRLISRGAQVRRVVLEQELKREYQAFLQAPNRGRRDSGGRSPRDAEEIARWAREHQLPLDENHVQFPDVRIEYEARDGHRHIEDVEVMTPHYRGAHAAAKVRAGFTRYRAVGARLGGVRTSGGRGRGHDPRLAEELLR